MSILRRRRGMCCILSSYYARQIHLGLNLGSISGCLDLDFGPAPGMGLFPSLVTHYSAELG